MANPRLIRNTVSSSVAPWLHGEDLQALRRVNRSHLQGVHDSNSPELQRMVGAMVHAAFKRWLDTYGPARYDDVAVRAIDHVSIPALNEQGCRCDDPEYDVKRAWREVALLPEIINATRLAHRPELDIALVDFASICREMPPPDNWRSERAVREVPRQFRDWMSIHGNLSFEPPAQRRRLDSGSAGPQHNPFGPQSAGRFARAQIRMPAKKRRVRFHPNVR